MVKNPLANAADVRDAGSISGSGRSPGHGNSLQYSCLENPTDRGARWATVHRFAKSQIQLKRVFKGGDKTEMRIRLFLLTSTTMGWVTADLLKYCLCQPL